VFFDSSRNGIIDSGKGVIGYCQGTSDGVMNRHSAMTEEVTWSKRNGGVEKGEQ